MSMNRTERAEAFRARLRSLYAEACGDLGPDATRSVVIDEYGITPTPPEHPLALEAERDARIRDLEEANAAISAKCDELRGQIHANPYAKIAAALGCSEAVDDIIGEIESWRGAAVGAQATVADLRNELAARPHVAGAMSAELRERIASAPAHSGPPTRLETLALDVFAWLQSADVPSEAPRVGPSITREQARAALDWHKRIGGEGFGIAPEWEPVYAMLRACADSEPAPTETAPASLVERAKAFVRWLDAEHPGNGPESVTNIVRDLANATPAPTVQMGPAITREMARAYLHTSDADAVACVNKALRAYADGSGEGPPDRWDEAIEAGITSLAQISHTRVSTHHPISGATMSDSGPLISWDVACTQLRALKGRGR